MTTERLAELSWRDTVLEWLERNERSQAWLARHAELDPSWISLILSGQREAGPQTLRKLEDAMGLYSMTLGS